MAAALPELALPALAARALVTAALPELALPALVSAGPLLPHPAHRPRLSDTAPAESTPARNLR